jgi:hypothetical protein
MDDIAKKLMEQSHLFFETFPVLIDHEWIDDLFQLTDPAL